MNDFTFQNPTKIIFGKTSMAHLRSEVETIGKKVLLTYGGGSIKKNGLYTKIIKNLEGFEIKEFGGIEPNPRVETIRKAVKDCRDFDPDLIVAVGGGSVVDGSKLLAASLHYDGDPWDFLVDLKAEPKRYVPLAVILTLSATGSEMNSGAVITKWETNEKPFFTREAVYPKFSILDPQNTYSVPKDQTAYGVIDAYSHVLEQYINTTKDTPLQDRFSEAILLTLIENGEIALKDPTNYEARANIMISATMALNGVIAMGVGEDWATHVIEHEFSAFYDIPHGAGLAIITPRWMQAVKTQKADKLAQYGERVWKLTGTKERIVEGAIKKTHDFFKSLGIKMSFTEWQIDDRHFKKMLNRFAQTKLGEIPLSELQLQSILTNSLTTQY